LEIAVCIQTIVRSFTERQLSHIDGEGTHRALSHQCARSENLKYVLDKQLEILSSLEADTLKC